MQMKFCGVRKIFAESVNSFCGVFYGVRKNYAESAFILRSPQKFMELLFEEKNTT